LLTTVHIYRRTRGDDVKPFTTAASGVFTLVALAQLLRVVLGWEVKIDGFVIPVWVSVIVCLIAATLAVMLPRENRT
jgi:hypothetical protein